MYIKENVIQQFLHSIILHKGKFYQRPPGISLSFNFFSGSLEQGYLYGGARGVMVIVTGYGHGDTSSIPGQDWLHFT